MWLVSFRLQWLNMVWLWKQSERWRRFFAGMLLGVVPVRRLTKCQPNWKFRFSLELLNCCYYVPFIGILDCCSIQYIYIHAVWFVFLLRLGFFVLLIHSRFIHLMLSVCWFAFVVMHCNNEFWFLLLQGGVEINSFLLVVVEVVAVAACVRVHRMANNFHSTLCSIRSLIWTLRTFTNY